MKFRYKVILLNLVLLSLTTGIVGFNLMQRSYDLTMNTEIKSAVTENNLVQSSVEYSLLEVVNSGNYDLGRSLPEIGQEVYSGMLSGEESLYIRYGGKYLYRGETEGSKNEVITEDLSGEEDEILGSHSEKFFTFPVETRKNYLILEENEAVSLFVTSETMVDEKPLNIITKRDITELSRLLDRSIKEYRQFTLVLLCVATLLLFVLSWLLTRPLERLSTTTNAFAAGSFQHDGGVGRGPCGGAERYGSPERAVRGRLYP